MNDAKLLAMLRCPIDGTPLSFAEPGLLDRLNAAIERGQMRNRAGQIISDRIDAALLVHQRGRIYPICRGIPTLIADQAIEFDVSESAT